MIDFSFMEQLTMLQRPHTGHPPIWRLGAWGEGEGGGEIQGRNFFLGCLPGVEPGTLPSRFRGFSHWTKAGRGPNSSDTMGFDEHMHDRAIATAIN